jgi:hypothetical protein
LWNSANVPASNLQQVLLHTDLGCDVIFVVPADCSHPSHWDDLISEAISCARRSNVDELFVSAELKNWAEFREITERLRLLPLPVHLVLLGPTSDLLQRPLSPIGNATIIELQRASVNAFQLFDQADD